MAKDPAFLFYSQDFYTTKQPEQIENLMGLCRWHHEKYGDIKQFKPFLNQVHHDYIIQRRGH